DGRSKIGTVEVAEELAGGIPRLPPAAVEEQAVAHEVADVGNHPRMRRLDEQVLVQSLDVALDQIVLGGDDAEQRAQRIAFGDVVLAYHHREQIPQTVGLNGHALRPPASRS